MAHVSLYRKYRPDSFAEVVGQDHVTETLARAVDGQSWHHAYLFCGPRGTGKTSSARLLAMGLNASSGPTSSPDPNDPIVVAIREGSCPDVIEIDAASNSGVDDVRDLRDKIAYSPTQGRLRIYIVDECHMLSNSAWNAFLKTIEEPPGHVVFIFATTEPHKVLPTVLSRTQRFDFRRVSDQVLTDHCKRICAAEGVSITDEALAPIVRAGDGSVRDTLSVLDQVIAFTGNTIDADAVNRVLGTVPSDLLDQLVNAIARADVADAFGLVGQVAEQGIDLRQFALDAQNHLRELLILNAAPEAGLIEGTPERLAELKASAASTDTDRLLFAVETLNDAQVRMRAGNTRLPLEVALAKAVLYGADRARDIPRLAPKPVTKAAPAPVAQPAPVPQPVAQASPQADAQPSAQTPGAPAEQPQAPAATVPDAAAAPVRVPESAPTGIPAHQPVAAPAQEPPAPAAPEAVTPTEPQEAAVPVAASAVPVAQSEPQQAGDPQHTRGPQAESVVDPAQSTPAEPVAPGEPAVAQPAPVAQPGLAAQSSDASGQRGACEAEVDLLEPPAALAGSAGAQPEPVAQPVSAAQPPHASGQHGVFEPEVELGDQAVMASPSEPGAAPSSGQHGAFEPEVDFLEPPAPASEGQDAGATASGPSGAPNIEGEDEEESLPPEPEQVESLFDDMPELEPEAVMPPASQETALDPTLVEEPEPAGTTSGQGEPEALDEVAAPVESTPPVTGAATTAGSEAATSTPQVETVDLQPTSESLVHQDGADTQHVSPAMATEQPVQPADHQPEPEPRTSAAPEPAAEMPPAMTPPEPDYLDYQAPPSAAFLDQEPPADSQAFMQPSAMPTGTYAQPDQAQQPLAQPHEVAPQSAQSGVVDPQPVVQPESAQAESAQVTSAQSAPGPVASAVALQAQQGTQPSTPQSAQPAVVDPQPVAQPESAQAESAQVTAAQSAPGPAASAVALQVQQAAQLSSPQSAQFNQPEPAPVASAAEPQAQQAAQSSPTQPSAQALTSQDTPASQETPANTPTLADATAAWNQVLTLIMGESKRIWSTYSQGEPSQVNGNTVAIGFRFPFHANMAAEPDAIAVASRHFTTVLGTKVKVATETNAQAEPIAPPQAAEVPVEQFEPEVEDTRAPIDPVDEDQLFRDAVALVKSELGATDTE